MGRVLVIEDDPETRETLEAMLEALGHEASLAPTGEEGLALLRDGMKPHYVILDLILPGMDGWACLHRIRYMAPLLPLVVITGDGAAPLLRGISFFGKAAALPKPFGLAELKGALARAEEAADA